jgi:Trk K+ transport system NAD-binding subunit
MIIFLALAEHLRVEAVLGAFLAGIIASLLSGASRDTLIEKLDVLGFGFLTPFFFFSVGIRFDLQQLLGDPTVLTMVPLLIVLTMAVKIVPGLLLLLWHPWRDALASAVLLGTQMSVTIAAAELLQRAGLIAPAIHQAFVMVAMVTAVVAPVVSAKIAPPKEHTEHQEKWVVVGSSRQAILLVGRLAATGEHLVLVSSMVKSKWEVKSRGVDFVYVDPTSLVGIQGAALGATVLVAMSGDDAYNLTVCKLAREQLCVQRIYALLSSPKLIAEAQDLGVEVVNPELAALQLLSNQVVNPSSTSLLEQEAGIHMADFRITCPDHIKTPLRSIHLPPTILIVAIWREGEKIIPHGDTQLHLKDRITVVGPAEDLQLLTHLFC